MARPRRSPARPVIEQMTAFLVAREEERCAAIEKERKKDESKPFKKVPRREIKPPWKRPMPASICQDHRLLLMISGFDYDLADEGFVRYCENRGVLGGAGDESSEIRRFVANRDLTFADLQRRSARVLAGDADPQSPVLESLWHSIRITRAKMQDSWELYRARSTDR